MASDQPYPTTLPNRQAIERAIDALIDLLDATTPDPDDEPDLGWTGGGAHGVTDDRERDLDEIEGGDVVDEPHDQHDEGDLEPSLGACEPLARDFRDGVWRGDWFVPARGGDPLDQSRWGVTIGIYDGELDLDMLEGDRNEDLEPEEDYDPVWDA